MSIYKNRNTRSTFHTKHAGLASDLLSNTTIGGIGGAVIGGAIGGGLGKEDGKSVLIGTLVGAGAGTLATILDYIHKKRGRYYYIPDNLYAKQAGLTRDLLLNTLIGSGSGLLLSTAASPVLNPYDPFSAGADIVPMSTLAGGALGATGTLIEYLMKRRKEREPRRA